MTGQFTTAKTSGCANVSLNSTRAVKVCRWDGGHPGLTVWNVLKLHKNWECLWSTQENFKTFVFYYVGVICTTTGGRTESGLCEPLRSIRLNCQLKTKLEMMHILQAQVWSCISAHPGLPHQETKREASDASKSQLNQASWKKTVLKFASKNQLNTRNYLSTLFCDFPCSHDLEKVTSLSVWFGVRRTPTV